MLDKTDVRQIQIASAFLEGLLTFQSSIRPLLDKLDETERRALIAQSFPTFSEVIEGHTREELDSDLQSLATALAVGAAIAWTEANPAH
ncbi:MAG: hypothetical protein ACOC58_00800 [Chloroflexota bacterium]